VRAEVQPTTATKVGPSYTSRSVRVGSPELCPDALPRPK
jgi:hypothetical protein